MFSGLYTMRGCAEFQTVIKVKPIPLPDSQRNYNYKANLYKYQYIGTWSPEEPKLTISNG